MKAKPLDRTGSLRSRHSRRSAFTLAELLVASVVVSFALTGVYALFRHAMDVEARAAVSWNDHEAASAVANHMLTIVANAVSIPDTDTIVLEAGDEGGVFICQTSSRRNRYRWYKDADEQEYTLELQTMFFSGEKCISPNIEWDRQGGAGHWDKIDPVIIGRRLKDIRVQCQLLKELGGAWRNSWKGASADVAIKCVVTVGDQTVQRVVSSKISKKSED